MTFRYNNRSKLGNNQPWSNGVMAISFFKSGTEQKVNSYSLGPQEEAQVARLEDGGWVVTWTSLGQDGSKTGIYQQRYNANGVAVGAETQVNSYTTEGQYAPTIVGLADGGWVISWTSYGQDGDAFGVYQQRYGADGNPVGGETRVNTYTTASQGQSSITALGGGGWLVTWASWQDGSSMGIYQQRYNANGAPVGGEMQVNMITAGAQTDPHVTALADGGWVVTWETEESGTPYPMYNIHQQRYNAQGNKVFGERTVNSSTAKSQTDPSVTALTDGGWVVVWTSDNPDGFGTRIYQQCYLASGDAVGGERRVDVGYMVNSSVNPSVTALSDGGWIITFNGFDGPGSASHGIYQQRYNSAGEALFSPIPLVNTTIEGRQELSDVVQLKDGSWVVTWQSVNQDRSEGDVFQSHYTAGNALTIDSETAVGDDADDTFLVRLGSLSTGDYITGGSGNDTLKMLDAGVMDLTKPGGLTGIETIVGSDGNDTIIADSRIDAFVNLQGGGGYDELRLLSNTPDQRGIYNLSGKTFTGFEAITLTVSGILTFTDKAAALIVKADQSLAVEVQLPLGAFSEAEKAKLFRQGVKTIRDSTGAYTNAAPDGLTLSGNRIVEKAGKGTIVGSLTALDPNPADTQFTYQLTSDLFELVTVDNVTSVAVKEGAVIDYETAQFHQLSIKVMDKHNASFTTTVTIAVHDLLEDIKGTSGKNNLRGGIGSDKIFGYDGNDKLTGGAGLDIFVFNTKLKSTNVDRLVDYRPEDTIWLDNKVFKKLGSGSFSAPKTLKKSNFTVGSKAKDKNDFIIHNKNKGYLLYDPDGSETEYDPIKFATLKAGQSLKYDEFKII